MHVEDQFNSNYIRGVRQYIKYHTIDEFCIKTATDWLEKHKRLYSIISQNIDKPNFVISSYSEMKNNYKTWNNKMYNILGLENSQRIKLYTKYEKEFNLQPLDNEKVINKEEKRHIRNGSDKQYITALQSETVTKLIELYLSIMPENIKGRIPDLKF